MEITDFNSVSTPIMLAEIILKMGKAI